MFELHSHGSQEDSEQQAADKCSYRDGEEDGHDEIRTQQVTLNQTRPVNHDCRDNDPMAHAIEACEQVANHVAQLLAPRPHRSKQLGHRNGVGDTGCSNRNDDAHP